MTGYEMYTLILCVIVFSLLVLVFGFMMITMVSTYIKAIRSGAEDEALKREYVRERKRKRLGISGGTFVSLLFGALFILIFAFSIFVNLYDGYFESIPTIKVVQSGSMSEKNKKNDYLVENNLNDQFGMFDLVLLYKIPDEYELEKYDIVLYEVDGTYVIHRIIEIEEPSKWHPDKRHFLCRGDASEYDDRYPVTYEQMRAIYRGESIPYVGSFVTFMQSPAGWLCMFLVLFATLVMPFVEKKLEEEKYSRLRYIDFMYSNETWKTTSAYLYGNKWR